MIKKIITLSALLFTNQLMAVDESAVKTVNSFEQLFGVTEGKRRNHTKGFCFTATLMPNDKTINIYSKSPLFTGESKVIGRLSHKGGNNNAADNTPAEYGMGLSISNESGNLHLMSMNTLDFFPVATPEAFAELMHAKTQKNAVKAFKEHSIDLQRFKAHMSKQAKTLTPYEGSTFNSINSFYLVNDEGKKTPVRWSFVPERQQSLVLKPKQDFFFNNMQQNLLTHGIVWDMVVTIANTDDQVENAAIQWQGKHQQIVAAKLKVISISSEQQGQCDEINYDPLVLSVGFEPSADPLLQARRNAYSVSFGRRISEKHSTNE